MTRYVYDGSFEGFLCACAAALREADVLAEMGAPAPGRPPDGASRAPVTDLLGAVTLSTLESEDQDLFSRARKVVTNAGEAAEMARRLCSAAGDRELDSLLFTHASPRPEVPRLLFYCLVRTLREGRSISTDVSDPWVLKVRQIQDQVSKEINKLMGFIRFTRVADRTYYAAVSPDCNIVGFLGPHFADRFPDMAFLIHDAARGLAFRHDLCGDSGMIPMPDLPPDLKESLSSDRERLVPAMWKEYFRRIAIPERRNPALQAKLMPRRYWKHMTEIKDRVNGDTGFQPSQSAPCADAPPGALPLPGAASDTHDDALMEAAGPGAAPPDAAASGQKKSRQTPAGSCP